MLTALPVVPMPRHRAVAWPASERAAMVRALQPWGVTITELSDVRERCGLPRLSSTDPRVRWAAPHILRGTRGQEALRAIREERALLTEALASLDPGLVFNARHMLGLRRSTPSQMRLGELRATYAEARVLQIMEEEREARAKAA